LLDAFDFSIRGVADVELSLGRAILPDVPSVVIFVGTRGTICGL